MKQKHKTCKRPAGELPAGDFCDGVVCSCNMYVCTCAAERFPVFVYLYKAPNVSSSYSFLGRYQHLISLVWINIICVSMLIIIVL